MNKFKRILAVIASIGIVFGANEALAVATYASMHVALNEKKYADSEVKGRETNASYYKLYMSCNSSSKFGTMAVLRGRPQLTNGTFEWIMNPALKCAKGNTSTKCYNVEAYAASHSGLNTCNYVSIRIYGNHCDDQRTGCIGSASAINANGVL